MKQKTMSDEEIRLMKDMYYAGHTPTQIAAALGRHISTITHRTRALRMKPAQKDGLAPSRTHINAAIREPLSGGNWMPARPGAMDYSRIPSRGIA
jgi:hypothetical protein